MAPRIVLIGASLSANKGAAAMLQAVISGIRQHHEGATFTILSTYPDDERRWVDRLDLHDVEVADLSPLQLAASEFPVALLGRVLRRFRRLTAAGRAIVDADLVIDLAGISFADGRGIATLGYNSLMTGLPLLHDAPTVKASQALGPFDERLNRLMARIVLPRLERIGARGDQTYEFASEVSPSNVFEVADLAFSLDEHSALPERHGARLAATGSYVCVLPSSVVRRLASADGIDYVARMADIIEQVAERTGRSIVLAPHSYRPDRPEGRMNDGPVCRDIAAKLSERDDIVLIDDDLSAGDLRAIVDGADALLTSRFHGMISGLATATPTVVVGWSHKYREVLADFDLEHAGFAHSVLADPAPVVDLAVEFIDQRERIGATIAQRLPAVRERSQRNFELFDRLLGSNENLGTVTDDLSGVIDSGMCIGCGACEAVDDTVQLVLDPGRKIWQPDSVGGADAASVCPAVAVDYPGLHDYLFPGAEAGPYGVVNSVHLAQSTNYNRNNAASSGGLIKEILRQQLAKPDIDGVIALGHVEGLRFEAQLLTDIDQIDELPGSIYHNLTQTRAIELLEEHEGRFVVVGIPCQFEGLFAYIRQHAPHLRDRIAFTIGLLCGWQYSYHSIAAMGEYLGFDPDRITDIAYRGGGPVGKLRVATDDGEEYSASRRVDFSYQVAFDRHFNTNRCHVCINHSNFLADLVVGDAWLPSTVFTKTGISLVICRNNTATDVMNTLEATGTCIVEHVTTEEIRESQTERVIFGEFAYAYNDYLREIGEHVPNLPGPNVDAGGRKSREEVAKFHRERVRKQELMRQGRYRYLRWRKATIELPRFLERYVRWFAVRILRVKSISGQRDEISRDRLERFR